VKKKLPLVSIITVTLNPLKSGREKLLKQCIESVHNQTYPYIEHLVVDGLSNDGTIKLLEEYRKKGWIDYISEKDNGIYEAMNKGITLSKGKYLGFLNSDDFYHKSDGIMVSISKLENTKAIFSYAPVFMLPEKGVSLYEKHPHLNPKIKSVFYTMPFCHQSMFIRKDILLKENKFNNLYKSAGDYDLVLRLCLKNYNSVFINYPFVTFRLGGISDKNQKQSILEVSNLYYNNYKKICSISKKQCKQIYCNNYTGIPISLAIALKENKYFDIGEYIIKKNEEYRKTIDFLEKQNKLLEDNSYKTNVKMNEILNSRSWKISQFLSKKYILLKKTVNKIKHILFC